MREGSLFWQGRVAVSRSDPPSRIIVTAQHPSPSPKTEFPFSNLGIVFELDVSSTRRNKHATMGHTAAWSASDRQITKILPVAGLRHPSPSLLPVHTPPVPWRFPVLPQGDRYLYRLTPFARRMQNSAKCAGISSGPRVLGSRRANDPMRVTYSNELCLHLIAPSPVTERVFTDPHSSARELRSFPILAVKCGPGTCPVGLCSGSRMYGNMQYRPAVVRRERNSLSSTTVLVE